MNISEPYVSVFLSEHHHMSVQMIGTAFTCLFIGASLFTWLFGKNTSKYKPVYIVLFGILLFWIGITAVTVNRNPYIVYAGLFSRGVNRAMLYFVQGVLIQRLKAVTRDWCCLFCFSSQHIDRYCRLSVPSCTIFILSHLLLRKDCCFSYGFPCCFRIRFVFKGKCELNRVQKNQGQSTVHI